MRNQLFALLLAASMLLTLGGCAGNSNEDTTEPVITRSPESTARNTLPAQTTAPTQPSTPEFTQTVLVDDENCTFRITAIDADNLWGYTLKAYLENKTDKDLMFSISNASVNGFMCDPFWAVTVSAGMKANQEISFPEPEFEMNGITQVTDIAFTLSVYDSEDWSADRLVEDTFCVYPMGEAAAREYPRQAQAEDQVLYDDENCTIIVTGFDPENVMGYTVNVYLENKTDKNLTFSIDGASVNGFMCDPFWAVTVAAGKKSNTGISWLESDFADNGITQVEMLTLPFTVYDSDDWTAEYLLEQVFQVRP